MTPENAIQHWLDNSIDRTKKVKRVIIGKIKEFGLPMSFDEMDEDWHNSLVLWASERGLSKNTIGNYTKHIKAFLNYCYKKKWHTNLEFKDFKKQKEIILHPYLTEDEIERIKALQELPKYLYNAQMIFLLCYHSGQRYSDVMGLTGENIKDDKLIFHMSKTSKAHRMPCHPFIRKNLEKKRSISNQKFNTYIKELCKLAEINEPFTIIKTKGGQATKITKPKYKLITAHTARRSFATNFYLQTKDIQATSKFLGHSAIAVTENYLKNTIDEITDEYSNNPFFT